MCHVCHEPARTLTNIGSEVTGRLRIRLVMMKEGSTDEAGTTEN